MKITDLNEDELLIIFGYCSELDHWNIVRVCKLFERVIEEQFFEKQCRNLLVVSHLKEEVFSNTLNGSMKFSDRLRVNKNWMYGSCKQITHLQHRENFETLLEMDETNLYAASLGELSVFHRDRKDGFKSELKSTFGSKNDSKIISLKRKNQSIAGCKVSGSIFTYDNDIEYNEEFVHFNFTDPLLDMDFYEDTFVTVSRSQTIFYRQCSDLGMESFDLTKTVNDFGFNSINFNTIGDKLLGTRYDAVHIIDPSQSLIINSYHNRLQVYRTKWISSSSFLFSSYNSPLSIIDTRSNVRNEFTCGNFTATSFNYDGNFGVIYGTLLGMMVLCDLRNLKTFERVFHLETSTICRHLIFDESHLYVSTDNEICLLNFDW